MLIKDFYKVTSLETTEGTTQAIIEINKDHDIFKGHFPDNPVMPGVCMMQIIKEITEGIVGKKLFMEKCVNVKFMALINPEINPVLDLELQILENDGIVKVKNISKFEDTVALKLVSYYRKV